MRVELMEEGAKVRVTLVKPSSINTPLFNKAKEDDGGPRDDFSPQANSRSKYQEIAAHSVASPLGAAVLLGIAALLTGKTRDRRVQAGLLALGALGLTGKGTLAKMYTG